MTDDYRYQKVRALEKHTACVGHMKRDIVTIVVRVIHGSYKSSVSFLV